jgi:site-specific DNA-adenine methylase
VINDSNESLVNVYRIIRDTPEELVGLLAGIQGEYHALEERTERRDYFMKKRRVFNEEHPDDITRAALFIFFMRTCYNGIYSVNRKGRLSVTFGTGSRTRILEEELIRFNHKLLQGVIILDGDTRERNRSSTSTRPTNPSTRPVPVPPTCRTTSMTTAR